MTSFLDPWRLCLVALIWGGVSSGYGQTTEWVYHKTEDGAHPDGNEQQLVWLMNRARANPNAEGVFLAGSGNADIASGIAGFGVDVPLMKSEFAALPSVAPAAFDRRLYSASLTHSLDLIARDAQDHTNQFERVAAAGFSQAGARASVFAYSRSAMHAHGALNIDWGNGPDGMQSGRGHRAAIMGGAYTNVGFATVPDTDAGTRVGPFVFSGAYCAASSSAANHFNRFLVGTVWSDTNGNDRYDPGEGMGGVRVQPNAGAWHAITGAAGGFALPVAANTTYSIDFSGGPLAATLTRTARVGTASVLLDVNTDNSPALTLTISREGGNVVLEWSGGTPRYQVYTTTALDAGWSPLGSPTQATRLVVTPTSPQAFYRVVDGQ